MKRMIPWLIAGSITLLVIVQTVWRNYGLPNEAALVDHIFEFGVVLVLGLFSFMGALIVILQDGNRVGWLMMLAAFAFSEPFVFLLSFLPSPPTTLTPMLWLLLWVQSWFWMLAIISIFQIVLHFPNGRPPSTRWNWINPVTLGIVFLIALTPMISEQIGPLDSAWAVDNPLHFFPSGVIQGVTLLSGLGLIVLAGGSLTSLYFRFRRGGYLEREQIKWLLFAAALILVAFGLLIASYSDTSVSSEDSSWQEFVFLISVLIFPLAIANAIFRYRLYDIDIIIRRTLSYGILTALLALVFFGGVILLQNIFSWMVGDTNSPLITVISTLVIAALFNPLRNRIQAFIDRRFYRRKYDAEQALAHFSAAARDEVDQARLTDALLVTVDETMQPDHVNIWLRKKHAGKSQ